MSASEDMETDNDLVAACKKKLLNFRIKELKDVLTQVGLSKQGRKQDLTDRILALLYDEGTPGVFRNNVNGKEGLLEIIDVTYRNMQEAMANDSSIKKHNGSSSSRARPKEEVDESHQIEKKLRCPCGSDLPLGAELVQCVDSDCKIWQHSSCVIVPERPMETISTPTLFLCETCRVKRADPFWAAVAHPLHPVKLMPSNIPLNGTNPHLSVEKTFKLTKADRDLVQKNLEYDVQVWCMLLNDTVTYRIQWPQFADLQVNGNPVKTVNRPVSQQLGANGRDDGAKITSFIVEGVNKISLSFNDARSFCFGVRLVRRRTLEQVFGMIPKEIDGEPFEDALARIHRCIGGGITAGNDDSDSDLEVIADSVPVSLRCPMSGSRMKTAGRFISCAHIGCFDLETFVGINERTRKWQCPVCLKNYSLEDIIIDPFFNRILHTIGSCTEEINEIDMKFDGYWRVKKAREAGDLSKWHRPDGSIEDFPISDTGKENAQGCNTLTLEMQRKVDESLMNQGNGEADIPVMDIITMSSTTSGNGEDVEDPSINQDGHKQLGVYCTEPEVSSRLVIEQNSGFPATNADVIVLSDSEDDDVSVVYPESILNFDPAKIEGHSDFYPAENHYSFSVAPPPTEGPTASSRNFGEHLISESSFPDLLGGSGNGCCGDDDNTASCARHDNENLSLETSTDPVSRIIDSGNPLNGALDLQSPTINGDISLDVHPRPPVSTDGISLVNGHESSSSIVEAQYESACETLVDMQSQSESREDALIRRTDGDSGSQSPSGSGSDLIAKRIKCDGLFSFPRQQRSIRRRVD